MNVVRKRKLIGIVFIVSLLGLASGLVLYALSENISLFYTPSQSISGEAPVEQRIRIGGMVVNGSVHRQGLSTFFDITDYHNTVTVIYTGILPDLFREGQGIVAQGQLDKNGQFQAQQVLAKHDENYMPPEVKASLTQ